MPETFQDVHDIALIWHQKHIPVILCSKTLLIKIPYSWDNREWLRGAHRNQPKWLGSNKCWQVPRSWLDDITRRVLERYDSTYIISPYREKEVCAPACWDALGLDCHCSCLGANHGQGDQGKSWFVVNEAYAVEWGKRSYSCRLITAKEITS